VERRQDQPEPRITAAPTIKHRPRTLHRGRCRVRGTFPPCAIDGDRRWAHNMNMKSTEILIEATANRDAARVAFNTALTKTPKRECVIGVPHPRSTTAAAWRSSVYPEVEVCDECHRLYVESYGDQAYGWRKIETSK
jgi:hypothetical protein